ncbi:MAG TPA: hypothetical protein VGC79_03805 [Polyangiaceae bacterium]
MNPFASFFAIALLTVGCASASHNAMPATTATTATASTRHARPARPAPPASQVELRHFYLLSPGPSATLVVTHRD